jgi:hypothetical protein
MAVATAVLGLGVQTASAAVPAKQMDRFKAIEGPFSRADSKWTAALSQLSPSASVAQVSKPSLAFVPALKTFDAGLQKCGFTGAGASDVSTIVGLNTTLIGILKDIHSVKSFESQFTAMLPKYLAAQNSLARFLGIPAADVII